MTFVLCVEKTTNGEPTLFRLPGQLDEQRAEVEEMIRKFTAGAWPMEGALRITASCSDCRTRAWRWADIKKIWIEKD